MTRDEILELFQRTGVVLNGHFRLTSGWHSPVFVECGRALQYPEHAEAICREMAGPFRDKRVSVVVGAGVGGAILAYETARALAARAAFAEKQGEKMVLRRGFNLAPGDQALVVEDAITTGSSVNEILELVTSYGATPVGVAVLVDRSGGKAQFGVPLVALLPMDLAYYSPAECPLCRSRTPLITVPKTQQ